MWQALIPILGTVFDKVLPDPQAAAEAKLRALELAQRGELAALDADVKLALGQIEVNKEEAASPDFFRGGWRPFVGWVCGTGFAVQFVVGPLGEWVAALCGHPVKFPELDLSELMPLLAGMLGLGGLRTFERVKGKA